HPHVAAVDHGLGRDDPLLVRGRGHRQGGGEGKREGEGLLHDRSPGNLCVRGGRNGRPAPDVQGLMARLTAPSSLLPWALPDWAAVAGQSKGSLSSSRPPTSRAASTTTA